MKAGITLKKVSAFLTVLVLVSGITVYAASTTDEPDDPVQTETGSNYEKSLQNAEKNSASGQQISGTSIVFGYSGNEAYALPYTADGSISETAEDTEASDIIAEVPLDNGGAEEQAEAAESFEMPSEETGEAADYCEAYPDDNRDVSTDYSGDISEEYTDNSGDAAEEYAAYEEPSESENSQDADPGEYYSSWDESSDESGTPEGSAEETYAEEPAAVSTTYLGNFVLTAYCACPVCCGSYASGYTASGTVPVEGVTVAMGGVDFGTQLMINGHIYTVEDRGTDYGHVDIYFSSHEAALQFGLQYADVYLVS